MEASARSVLWLGGAPCAGKSSIAQRLGDRFALDVVHIDDTFDACTSRLDTQRHPALSTWMGLSWNERWARSPELLLSEVVSCYREHLGFVLEHLGTRTGVGRRTLVEGSAILPADIAPTLGSSADATWLVPTPGFQAQHYALRPWVSGIVRQCSDPAGAFERWMGRDAGFAQWLKREVRSVGLTSIKVDGSRGIDEIAEVVAQHFGLTHNEELGR